MTTLSGKVALVIGGTSGIGKASAMSRQAADARSPLASPLGRRLANAALTRLRILIELEQKSLLQVVGNAMSSRWFHSYS